MVEGFAELLRGHRRSRRLTQEELAELAGISARSVGAIERVAGRAPRPSTVDRLAAALGLDGADRAAFVAAGKAASWAGRGPAPRPADGPAPVPPGPPPASSGPAGARVPRLLPPVAPDLVGRDDELAVLARLLAPATGAPVPTALSGPPGAGKTTLAVAAGHRAADDFPDGQLFVPMRDPAGEPADPAELLAEVLRLLGVEAAALPAGTHQRAARLRDRLAGRRVLLVVDDAVDHGQVEPLLPPAGSAMLVTSRMALTGLPGVVVVDVRPLTRPAGVELLRRVAGRARVDAEPVAARAVVASCGGLPLAVRVAGARLAARPRWTVGVLAGRLADERRALDELSYGDLAVRPGLRLARRGLTPAAARLLALLGTLDVPTFPGWLPAALLGAEGAAGASVLDELVHARLVDELDQDATARHRYQMHETVRLFARELAVAEVDVADRRTALARAATGWLTLARVARAGLRSNELLLDDGTGAPEPAAAAAVPAARDHPVEWFEAERPALGAVVASCAAEGLTRTAWQLAGCCADFYDRRAYGEDWKRTTEVALDAARAAGDGVGELVLLRSLGACLIERDDWVGALAALRVARRLALDSGQELHAAAALKDVGFALGLTGRLADAEAALRTAVAELRRTAPQSVLAVALANLGFVLRQRGEIVSAVSTLRSAVEAAERSGSTYSQAYAVRGLAGALLEVEQPGEAERAAARAAALFDAVGDVIGATQSLRVRAEALDRLPGRSGEAEQGLVAVIERFRRYGFDWGVALAELSLGEIRARRGSDGAAVPLERSLRYWRTEGIPALQARALTALADIAQRSDDGDAAAAALRTEADDLRDALSTS